MWRWLQHAAGVWQWLVVFVACNTTVLLPSNATLNSNTSIDKVAKAKVVHAAAPSRDCWQGGYTAEVCCKANPVVNCWDSVFTFGRCCTGQASTATTMVTTTRVGATAGVTTTVTTVTSMSTVAIESRGVWPAVDTAAGAASTGDPAPVAASTGVPAPVPPVSGSAVGRGAMGATPAVQGDPACWKDGFTYKRCCEVPPIVAAISGCWDPVFTERRCCGTRVPPSTAAPAVAETRRRPPAIDTTGGTSQEASSSVSAPIAAILSALSSPKAWGETIANTSPDKEKSAGAVEALAEAAPENRVVATDRGSIAPEDSVDASLVAARGSTQALAETVPEKRVVVADRSSIAPDDSIDASLAVALGSTQAIAANVGTDALTFSSGTHSDREEPLDDYDDGSQAAFFRREGSRRFVAYFQKAHKLLNKVLSADDATSDESQDSWRSDAVQIYHLLYETVNQLVGGMQLAFEATGQHDERQESEAPNPGSSAAMRATFLSAAMVLARLAQASRGTPLEHEDFGAQATAAIALSCPSRNNPEAFRSEMSRRIAWLEQNDSAKISDKSGTEIPQWRAELVTNLRQRINDTTGANDFGAMFERSWQMYAEDLVEAVWRPANGRLNDERSNAPRSTLNPTDESLSTAGKAGHMWQIFPSFLMTKSLQGLFSRSDGAAPNSSGEGSCAACEELTRIVLDKYAEFEEAMRDHRGGDLKDRPRQDEINNAFFAWQLTHESEQEDYVGQEQWPELYTDSRDFQELRYYLKLACLEYLQQVYDPQLSEMDLAQLDLTLWASVTPPNAGKSTTSMDMPFHDHPLALLSGVFYAQAGGTTVGTRTPTVFADPRGTTAFRYTRQASRRKRARDEEFTQDTPEPTAPFHRLAYSHASDGKLVVFPSWLVHGVPPHRGDKARVVFAFNLHTLQGTTLSSWAKTSL